MRVFLVDEPLVTGREILHLNQFESRHARTVLRVRAGDRIELMDGLRGLAQASVVGFDKNGNLEVKVNSVTHLQAQASPNDVTICLALIKSDALLWAVEKCVELGVARLNLMFTDFSLGSSDPRILGLIKKVELTARQSIKQCRRPEFMTIGVPRPVSEILLEPGIDSVVLHPGMPPLAVSLAGKSATKIQFLIGPEGGFSEREVKVFENNSRVIWAGLGSSILRAETAALVCAARAFWLR